MNIDKNFSKQNKPFEKEDFSTVSDVMPGEKMPVDFFVNQWKKNFTEAIDCEGREEEVQKIIDKVLRPFYEEYEDLVGLLSDNERIDSEQQKLIIKELNLFIFKICELKGAIGLEGQKKFVDRLFSGNEFSKGELISAMEQLIDRYVELNKEING